MNEAGDRNTPALIWCPFADTESAESAANILLDEGLVACVNIIGQVTSLFAWNGKRDRTMETGVLLKTNAALLGRAIVRLEELHPYDEPAIVGWRCDAAAPGTVSWLAGVGR
ncbi:MAG: divalent-cation tolerance protein CutA [Novosphingobium sp.]|nr:divalent-cation tolerance protein CutA [Novosphingobium sp.]